jgi:hypothetical protein
MKKEQLRKKIDSIVTHYQKVNMACDQLSSLGVMDYHGTFFDSIWSMFDELLDQIDPHGWIAWYIFDNECGNKGLLARYNGKEKNIKNTEDLAKVMKWHLKQDVKTTV